MTITDLLHYATVGNPVSKAVIGTTASVLGIKSASSTAQANAAARAAAEALVPALYKLNGRNHNFVRLAGLSGAAAVVLGAIGSHRLHSNMDDDKAELKGIFDTANRFHFFHSLALLGVPLSRSPLLSGTLFIVGSSLFSGILYYRAFTGDKKYARYAPIGGSLLILAWLSLML